MTKRVIAAFLSLLMLLTLLPPRANAVGNKEQRIKDTIVTTYYRSLRRTGKASFIGYCGACVNNQIYYMGITNKVVGCHGKDVYNRYSAMETTTGGFPTRSYYGRYYSLRSALNTISENGTKDVYNMVVGFQKTTTTAGEQYGHAVFIYAILDGTVYFAECCPIMLDGRYWPECTAVYCSLDTFCSYYEPWTTFEGVVWFGNNTYAQECTYYDAALDGMVTGNTDLLADIPGSGGYASPEVLSRIYAGEIVSVIGLMETPDGEYWYEVEWGGKLGFLEASRIKPMKFCMEDVQPGPENVHMPSYLRQGRQFALGGELKAGTSSFSSVRITLTRKKDKELLYDLEETVQTKSYALSNLASGILWHKLAEGDYVLTIFATVEGLYVENGQKATHQQNMELWKSEFRVIKKNIKLPQVTFHPCGGDTVLERTVAVAGEPMGCYPMASRPGYVFGGWYTDPEEGEAVNANTTVSGDLELYARWVPGYPDFTGWLDTEQGWTYYRKGKIAQGWFYYSGKRFYQNSDGTAPAGWTVLDGESYYFSESGVMATGWVETDKGTCFLRRDGTKHIGWIKIRGTDYYFNEAGLLTETEAAD